jgi:hypothetical protein
MTDELKEELAGQKTTKTRKRLKISVSQDEIDNAMAGRTDKCMIHQAIKKAFPGFERISVDKNQVRVTDSEANVIYTFPMSPFGRAQILMWDAGEEVQPFDLWLRNPVIRERKIGPDGYPKPVGPSDSSKGHGPVRRPRTKQSRAMSGRDRIHGQKLWSNELQKLRDSLLPGLHKGGRGATCSEPDSSVGTEASS